MISINSSSLRGLLMWSSKPTTRGRQRISLFKDFTCIQKLLRVLALETSDTQVKGRGNSLIPSYKYIFFSYESPYLFIKNPDINSRIYEAPNAMTPSCFSVLQYSTLQTHSKGQNTFPSIPLIKPGFLLLNHPQYPWKRIRTEGGLPTSKGERLELRFPKRKAPIFLI